MIYLLDDDKYNLQQTQYNVGFLSQEPFNGFVRVVRSINETTIEELRAADCVLIHDSFPDDRLVERVKIDLKHSPQKPYVCIFSNAVEFDEPNFNEEHPFTLEIMKDRFYGHLREFLEHYQNTREIEFRILLDGKDFVKQKARSIQERLLRDVATFGENEKVMLKYVEDRASLKKLFVWADRENEYREYLEDIGRGEVRTSEYRDRIRGLLRRIQNGR